MPFDWMHSRIPEGVQQRNRQHRIRMHRDEIRYRAGLFRRLGHPQDYAVHRCLGNVAWGFELGGHTPLEHDDIVSIVREVYGR